MRRQFPLNSLLLRVPKGEGHVTPQGTTGSVERQKEREDCGHESLVSVGRNGQCRESRRRTGWFE